MNMAIFTTALRIDVMKRLVLVDSPGCRLGEEEYGQFTDTPRSWVTKRGEFRKKYPAKWCLDFAADTFAYGIAMVDKSLRDKGEAGLAFGSVKIVTKVPSNKKNLHSQWLLGWQAKRLMT